MPWKERSVLDERMKFVGRLLSGEKMAPLCREFGISRVTGHKLWSRYREFGAKGLFDRSRAPHNRPNQVPFEIEQLIVRLKRDKPHWGAPKLRELISKRYPTVKLPSTSTVHCVLDRHGLVKQKKRRAKFKAVASYLSIPTAPNDLWCADFKGQFLMGNRQYCYPLTITDARTRFLLCCDALNSTEENPCFQSFEAVFQEFGLPIAIRTDNGVPFACSNSLWNLSRLSIWWIRQGIKLERIEPGHPQQNGQHERMHRTLKQEATQPAKANLLQQQERFYRFIKEFNCERPHQALEMKCPADLYAKSPRPYRGLPDVTYPGYDRTVLISNCGRVCIGRYKIHVSRAFANQPVGLKAVDDGIWLVNFMEYELGFFDLGSKKFSPRDDPFGIRLSNEH